ncbi:MAG: hypothetical protein A2583_00920 [Bdellovibrionales bacterium RIFOXYD1_FULL_53_11]|nr:MAG: hypothetical protein A2583_00920 [Bdellovibrionales bacterium RIFOXYD1_FULL_53_11]
MNSNSRNNKGCAAVTAGGFTLLEVIIALAVLAIISVGIYQAIGQTYRMRDLILGEGDFFNSIRLSMGIVERDIASIYTPDMMRPEEDTAKPADPKDMAAIMETETTQYWSGAADKLGIRNSRFVGTETTMTFISASHIRIYKEAPESELAQISYELKRDSFDTENGTSILVKRESPNVYEDDDRKDKLQRTYPLLPGLKKFSIRYYHKALDRWEQRWDTEKEEFKNIFPDMIEISVEVVGPSRLRFDGVYKFRPEVPIAGLEPST